MSPETMVSPGVPTTVASAIAANAGDPRAMAQAVVKDVMNASYALGGQRYGPAAAFDVLDLARERVDAADVAIKRFNDDLSTAKTGSTERIALREDVRSIEGMVRFPDATPDMPWHADRPAIAMYKAIASDGRLDNRLRSDAAAAAGSIDALVLAHKESKAFAPFGGSSYADAAGPTIHAPVSAREVDPWAPAVSETRNAFYKDVDQQNFTRVVA